MSNNTNLLRDLNHVDPDHVSVGWSGFSAIISRQVQMNNDQVVHQTVGVQNQSWQIIGGSNYYGSGLYMAQPIVDDTPYHVKLYLGTQMNAAFFVGYGPASPTGLDDVITKSSIFPIAVKDITAGVVFDDIILMPGLKQGHPDFQKPLGFGVVVESTANHTSAYHLSVQNLAKTAPQFAASMS